MEKRSHFPLLPFLAFSAWEGRHGSHPGDSVAPAGTHSRASQRRGEARAGAERTQSWRYLEWEKQGQRWRRREGMKYFVGQRIFLFRHNC